MQLDLLRCAPSANMKNARPVLDRSAAAGFDGISFCDPALRGLSAGEAAEFARRAGFRSRLPSGSPIARGGTNNAFRVRPAQWFKGVSV